MKQIMLITDGCSNMGVSPILAAALAMEAGITVNVAGVIDYGTIGDLGSIEISDIAKAGGGISRIVGTQKLAHTMQMMTRKTVVQTIQQAVNKELKQILGDTTIEDLPPQRRSQVVQVVDELTETTPLQVALLIDASASMKPKLSAVEDAIRDLMLSLQAREGFSELAIFHYPGRHNEEDAVMNMNWTSDISNVKSLFHRIQMKGVTPTGPAIMKVIDFFRYGTLDKHETWRKNSHEEEGILGGNVV
ncbi:vWA domain-containing protein [Paenibacillus sp. CMAA1364]